MSEGVPGGRAYQALDLFTRLVYLNALWLLACTPVLTIPVATAALFGVVRTWVRGDEPPTARTFFFLFRENLRQALWVGLVWALLGAVLAADILLVGQMGLLRRHLLVALLMVGIPYAYASVYLFPVMVNYELRWRGVLKNALLYALAQPFTTLQCLLVVAVAAFAVVSLPVTLIIAGSLTAYCVYSLCERTFREVEGSKKGTRSGGQAHRAEEEDVE